MRPPVSPLSTTTTRRTSCTLATRIPPNYEPGSRFRVLAPDGSEVDVTVPAGAEAGDMIQVPLTVTDQPNWAPTGGVKYTQARPSGKWSTSLFNVTDHLGICGLSCFFFTAPILFGQIYEKQPFEDSENFPLDGFEDACCALFCGPCVTAQMARHEYLEVETGIVRYDCCSATGE